MTKLRNTIGSALVALAALATLATHGTAVAQAGAAASAPAAAAATAQAPAASAPAAAASAPAAPYVPGTGTVLSDKGADSCLECHDDESDAPGFSTAAIFKTPHASRTHPKSPFAKGGLQCEACHGPGARHSDKNAKAKLTTNSQKRDSFLSVPERNQACLTCHESGRRNAWHVGGHDRNQVACADCHRLHNEVDPVLAKSTQANVCYACHKQQRADFQKASTHPVRQGLMTCSDCHNTHGGAPTTAALVKPTLNQTCYSCHAEKRGPLLWEHAPVAEDCATCHTAHGSVRPALLAKSAPLLCQSCHSPAGHPSVARTASGLPANGGIGAIFTVAGSCTNCHTQVHGSNHPAGAKLLR